MDSFPVDWVMEAGDLVDAALVGFDRGELITIPPLPDEAQWDAYEAARVALLPNLSRAIPADRYRPRHPLEAWTTPIFA